jgi:type II secretory ATPase GspE/PulE/Tfp pilus assembly ATPase PilB-like protein
LRIDGALHPIASISQAKYHVLFSAIASAANLSTAANESQTGHIVRKVAEGDAERTLNMRVETAPTAYGQDVVMRLFNFDETMLQLDMLGLNPDERSQLDQIISHPRGLVMVVGPTGSGKSTTLYSILNALNDTSRKLVTLEDPIEYDITGVTQIPIDTDEGHSFADGFRGVLRLDPDVVMVGEIRDSDTAKTAIQASITGHLVLCTFHAQDAAAAFARIIDMIGVNPIFATAVRLVIGQRLVRRLDDATKIEYEPDQPTQNWIRQVLADLPASVEKPNLDNIKLWQPGQSDENPFGYKGRTVLMEQMIVDEKIQAFLRGDQTDINASEIEKSARADGMVTMLQKGVLKALAGETTIEEVNKVL